MPFSRPRPISSRIPRHFELGLDRHFDLRMASRCRSRFACDLRRETISSVRRGRLGEPGKQRVARPVPSPSAAQTRDKPLSPTDIAVCDASIFRCASMNSISARATACARISSSLDASSGRPGSNRAALYLVRADWNSANRGPASSLAQRVHPTCAVLIPVSSLRIDRGSNDGDPVSPVVGRVLKFFAEHVRIDLFV